MIVRENISFERGQDPKSTMGLGIGGIIDKEMMEYIFTHRKTLGSLFSKGDQGRLEWAVRENNNEWVDWVLKSGKDFTLNPPNWKVMELRPDVVRLSAEFANYPMLKKLLDYGFRTDERALSDIVTSYVSSSAIGKRKPYQKILKALLDTHEFPMEYMEYLLNNFLYRVGDRRSQIAKILRQHLDKRSLKESINFNRGENPKETIGLGIDRLFKRIKDRIAEEEGPEFYYHPVSQEIYKGIPIVLFRESFRKTGKATDARPYICISYIHDNFYESGFFPTPEESIDKEKKKIDHLMENPDSDFYTHLSKSRMNESVNFERGLDPKRAMGLGSVKVKGDRGYGDYKVRLIKPYKGSDLADGEEAWEIEYLDSEFAGATGYAFKYPSSHVLTRRGYWGEIDSFLGEVNESLDFERGMNPKQSMGVGVLGRKGLSISNGYVSKGSKIAASIGDIVYELTNYYKKKGSDRAIFRFPANTEPPEFLVTARPGEEMDWPEQGYRKISYEEIVTELILLAQNDPEFIRWFKSSDYKWDNWQPLLEEVNFERGKDPREVLGLGIEKQIDNFLKSVDQSTSNLDHKLKICARYGKVAFVEYLIKQGANPRAQGDIALIMAVNRNDADMVETLLKAGSQWGSRYISSHRIKKISPEIKNLLDKYKNELDESLDFERGKNAMDTLKLGIRSSLQSRKMGFSIEPSRITSTILRIWNDISKALDVESPDDVFFLGRSGSSSITTFPAIPEDILENISPYIFTDEAIKKSVIFDMGTGNKYQLYQTPWGNILRVMVWGNTENYYVNYETAKELGLYKYPILNESVHFERGIEPYRVLNVGVDRLISRGESIDVLYKGNIRKCTAIDDEELDERTGKRFIDFVDPDGDMSWAVRNEKGEWIVPSANESIDFERGQDPKKALDIGMNIFDADGLGIYTKNTGFSFDEQYAKDILKNMGAEVHGARKYGDILVNQLNPDGSVRSYSINYLIRGPGEYSYVRYAGELYPIPNPNNRLSSIKESVSFERREEPKDSLGIGNPDVRMINKIDRIAMSLGFQKVSDISQYINSKDYEDPCIAVWTRKNPKFIPRKPKMRGIEFFTQISKTRGMFSRNQQVALFKEIREDYDNRYYVGAKTGRRIMFFDVDDFLEKQRWENIFEGLEFERGKDPKKAIGIGGIDITAEIKKMYTPKDNDTVSRETYERIKKFLSSFLDRPLEGTFKKGFFEEIGEYKFVPFKFITFFGGSRVIFEDKVKMSYEVIPGERYFINLEEKMNETIDFERGMDPKRAMKIGLPKEFPDVLTAADWAAEHIELITNGKHNIRTMDIDFSGDFLDSINTWLGTVDIAGVGDIKTNLLSYASFLRALRELLIFRRKGLIESVRFQRSTDLKSAIGIGMNKNVREMIERLLMKDLGDINEGRSLILYLLVSKSGKYVQIIIDALDEDELESGENYLKELIKEAGLDVVIDMDIPVKIFMDADVCNIFFKTKPIMETLDLKGKEYMVNEIKGKLSFSENPIGPYRESLIEDE